MQTNKNYDDFLMEVMETSFNLFLYFSHYFYFSEYLKIFKIKF